MSLLFCVFVFFFKQKTAYEMRISDWSSDVCSSDLHGRQCKAEIVGGQHWVRRQSQQTFTQQAQRDLRVGAFEHRAGQAQQYVAPSLVARHAATGIVQIRSEERRVGKEGVSTCRSRWAPNH